MPTMPQQWSHIAHVRNATETVLLHLLLPCLAGSRRVKLLRRQQGEQGLAMHAGARPAGVGGHTAVQLLQQEGQRIGAVLPSS